MDNLAFDKIRGFLLIIILLYEVAIRHSYPASNSSHPSHSTPKCHLVQQGLTLDLLVITLN